MDFKPEIQKAIELLRGGEFISIPTNTIRCICCDATNSEAVNRLIDSMQTNKKTELDFYECLIANDQNLNRFVKEIPAIAWDLIDVAEKPISIVLQNAHRIAPAALKVENSGAFRMIKEGNLHRLLYQFAKPVLAIDVALIDSANLEVANTINDTDFCRGSGRAPERIKIDLNGQVKILNS